MQNVEKADVMASGRLVGCLALTNRGLVAFEYSPQWIESGFSVSPFSMPLKPGLYTSTNGSFEYIAGVFDDCIPDGWGRLLTDRYLASIGIDYTQASVITRLCMLGDTSSGLLEFVPRLEENKEEDRIDLDASFSASRLVLADKDISQSTMDDLFRHGGSSGGARPKVNVRIDGDLWIVKFPTSMDGDDAGVREYECNKRAVDAGLETADFQLMESRLTKGFFACKRFDRRNGRRIHMISLSGLLESSHRYPALDYRHLLKATYLLTKDETQVYEAFRRAVFNVKIGNQDDHGKNFAFLYDEEAGLWRLFPAYDLTVSTTYYGEHSTSVCGKGKGITDDDLRRLADEAGLDRGRREEILKDVSAACRTLSVRP